MNTSTTICTNATPAEEHLDQSNESTSHSMTQPTPVQDKLASNIDQMTKRIEAHVAGLSSSIIQTREEALKVVRHLTKD